jgi:hypothetical protein
MLKFICSQKAKLFFKNPFNLKDFILFISKPNGSLQTNIGVLYERLFKPFEPCSLSMEVRGDEGFKPSNLHLKLLG